MRDPGSYSAGERGLHRLAFGAWRAQIDLSDLEDRLYGNRLGAIQTDRPVFICSLPRAGTTLLLELLAATGEYAAHTYRDMPFVLCPMIWNRLSRPFRRPPSLKERAHGDGMQIGFDSPEALEEALWLRFWPDHYGERIIRPWAPDERNARFGTFFRNHMSKIIALRSDPDNERPRRRYLAKNNANFARTDFLLSLFPEARIVVPIRHPLDHISSLVAQHCRFSKMQSADPFVGAYMAWLGHFEFGELLKPIDFDGWRDRHKRHEPGTPMFWAQYWLAGYRYLLKRRHRQILILNYDRLCQDPRGSLQELAAGLEMDRPQQLSGQGERLRPPREYDHRALGLPAPLRDSLGSTHEALKRAAIEGEPTE